MAVAMIRHLKAIRSNFLVGKYPLFCRTGRRQISSYGSADSGTCNDYNSSEDAEQSPDSNPLSTQSKRDRLINSVRQAEMRRREYRNFLNKRRQEGKASEGKAKNKYDDLPTPNTNWRLIALKVTFAGWIGNGANVRNITSRAPSAENSSREEAVVSLQRALVRTRLIDDVETNNFRSHDLTSSVEAADGDVIGQSGGIVTLEVRTNLSSGVGVRRSEKSRDVHLQRLLTPPKPEIRFSHVINHALPDGLRVTAWAPLPVIFGNESVNPESVSFFLPKTGINVNSLINLEENILQELRGSGYDCEKVVDVRELTDEAADDSSSSCLDLIVVQISLRKTAKRLMEIRSSVERALKARAGFHAISTADSSSYLFLHTNVFDDLNWQYDVEALADAALHFQRLQTELAIKAAITQQALERVGKLMHPDGCPDEEKLEAERVELKRASRLVRPYVSPVDEIMTFLPNYYLLRNYDSYVDFLEKNKTVWEKWGMSYIATGSS